MDDLIAFVTARLDGEEAEAKACPGPPRHANHDPARVLREVAVKRGRLERYLGQSGYDLPEGVNERRDDDERMRDEAVKDALEEEIREDAAVWSDHPDYPDSSGSHALGVTHGEASRTLSLVNGSQ